MKAGFELTEDNYYSPTADRHYMSCSLYDRMASCEARTLAEITGDVEPNKTEGRAFAVGHYFHAAFEGREAFQSFVDAHWNDVYKPASQKKYADIIQADEMLNTARKDPQIAKLIRLKGNAEVIMAGTLFGTVPWRVRFDKYVTEPQRVIIDWKTVSDLYETYYNPDRQVRESFVRHWGYDRRAAVYIEVEKQSSGRPDDAVFPLVCLSKQNPPAKEIFLMNNRTELDAALDGMRDKALHYRAVIEGSEKAERCERCAYCRSTKRITEPKLFTVLDGGKE